MRPLVFLVISAVFWVSCGGDRHQIKIGPVPDRMTRGSLAGPLCSGTECKCRTDGQEVGAPEQEGRKRFELRLQSPYELWVTLPNGTLLYKNAERAEACFYVDIAPGQHPVEMRASNASGVSASLEVHELGDKGAYDTFKFNCGNPGVCSYDQVSAEMSRYQAIPKALHDPCGSTKIRGIGWDHGKDPDQLHPSNLVLQFTLDVYKFKPEHASGAGEVCGKRAAKGDGG
ncbi:MAG: hypothetical protein KIT31_05980 [Deltaproteobacteria bacterium]|nr:hypothetical protein [Deltaproteobacteria bacterium]